MLRAAPVSLTRARTMVVALGLSALALIALSFLREARHSPLDPLALLLRVLGGLMVVRVAFALGDLRAARRERRRLEGASLRLAGAQLTLSLSAGTLELTREEVDRVTTDARGEVWLVLRPTGAGIAPGDPLVRLGNVFPGVEQQLALWLRDRDERSFVSAEDRAASARATENASSRYDELAGRRDELAPDAPTLRGVTLLRLGRGFLTGIPLAGTVGGIAFAEAALRSGVSARLGMGWLPLVVLGLGIAMPTTWWRRTSKRVQTAQGLAAILLPHAALFRVSGGILRAEWSEIERVRVVESLRPSPIFGMARDRSVVLVRRDGPPIRLEAGYLAAPVDVVKLLCDRYRAGARDGTQVSQRTSTTS